VNIIPYHHLSNLAELAEGGFGIVYRAKHEHWGTVAYKELKATVIIPETRLMRCCIVEFYRFNSAGNAVLLLLGYFFAPQEWCNAKFLHCQIALKGAN